MNGDPRAMRAWADRWGGDEAPRRASAARLRLAAPGALRRRALEEIIRRAAPGLPGAQRRLRREVADALDRGDVARALALAAAADAPFRGRS